MKKIILTFSIFCCTLFFAQKSENYVQISYNSICCGTPSTDPVMKFISQFQKKNKIKSIETFKQSGLGREGEFKLYVGIDQLSKKQKVSFIKGLQSAIELQNSTKQKNSDGNVGFDETDMVTKADLKNVQNLTIYKK